ncbi:hypothetical protein Pcinc_010220 [Petrolisthes cinctipes]|uniref:Uncharacterized protein n=1 Tax=Petrolisthes cinctipes TaxID=88211 RepID=A0AAE1G5V2_PETCI|nr:hypothetical protein Pcinc_029890 [Petrolisthes cinctipes]KAK3876248.1 hypothetical protein Pcinc_018950 [Petrolisthes cinctipes]KAK3879933.1 hypothetical protein Pcinc_015541 [Petrolisthes cinctipes]KAK3883372.1 hypothetical protein Pcinc_012309 [Petrolisthes cinctipes]KAK3885572.1 hypothetical protein Pcinc_010220 [Petrolisthes cinctipes]
MLYLRCFSQNRRRIQKVQNTVGAELRKNRGASFCKICSVFLTHHKKIQPLLKLRLLEELKNMNFIVPTHHKKIQPLLKLLLLEELNHLNFIVPIAALSLRIPPSKPSC